MSPAPVVAAFDFDGTLTRGGSVWPFLVAVRGRRRVATAAAALMPKLAVGAALGGRYADDAKEALFRRTLAGLPAAEVAERAAAFGRAHYRRHARVEVRERMEWHRARGHRLVIVSASPDCYLIPLARDLAVDTVVATRLAVGTDGRLTGGYDGKNCRGHEKLRRVRRWIDDIAGPTDVAPVLWAYGNSAGDRQLLTGADFGIDVGRLGRVGALRSFPRLSDLPGDGGDGGEGGTLTTSGGRSDTSSAASPGTRRRRR
ncbi:MAG TPA: HAD-IB family hydrolase [Acidimicrobiales bacterium]|nr:HAD-IB family hydrolase [Acidimicrobiales bacterium]